MTGLPPNMPRSNAKGRLSELLDSQFTARLDALDLVSRKILQGKLQGERRAKRRGSGVDFADHRPYVVGDDLRFVDWNIYGRLDQLFLKLFLEEQDLTVHILLDASGSVAGGTPTKQRAIKRLSAALAYVGLVNNNRLTLSAFADGLVGQLPNLRGRNYLNHMADFLLNLPAEGPSRFERACQQLVAGRIGSGVMVVVSDFLFKEGYEEGLKRLVSDRYDLFVIQMLSPQELAPDFGGDLRLVDMEDLDTAEVTISSALLRFYKRNLSAYCNEIKDFCARRGAAYVLTNSRDPVEALVLNYLRRRGLLR